MARKAVLTGGKRDEIIKEAMKLFFENGYEATSVRMIMDRVGGEIGMFYHYFKSKDELFDKVAEAFFRGYEEKFATLIKDCSSPEEFVDSFLPLYGGSMEEFGMLRTKMHWSVQASLAAGTIAAMRPFVSELLVRWDIRTDTSTDILAGQLLYGISATIHSEEFGKMEADEKKKCLITYMNKVMERA